MMNSDQSTNAATVVVSPYPQEALLVDALAEVAGRRLLCTSPGLAQFAGAAARALPGAIATCTYLDLYRAGLALEYWQDRPSNLRIECAADLPDEECDVVALPLSASGEAELARELMQAGHERLAIGGKLYASTENLQDTWLDEQLRRIFSKVERRVLPSGLVYVGTKTAPLRKIKNFACEFAFRDRGRLIRAVSRPGVFSHRHIDPGARHLIDQMEIEAGDRVLDIGCGAGTVALAAACRADDVLAHAVDSNARAIECTRRGAELNGLGNVTVELNAAGSYENSGHYDVALANPPYYCGFRIAEHFLTAGRDALAMGGKILVVTKHPAWYQENMSHWFDEVSMVDRKGYYVFRGVRPLE